jgi:hypothetical protein
MVIPFTGFALKIYLNERPFEPRERLCLSGLVLRIRNLDRIWVYALYEILHKYLAPKIAGPVIICRLLAKPVLMASQNWDDHDRSGKLHRFSYG